ncbi:MAG: hypothetical protein KKD44_05765 [Proteobacteria bacterium]|nr:hypothetical protein [Pseudomonadota bacterium]
MKETPGQRPLEKEEKKNWEKPDFDILDIAFDTALSSGSGADGNGRTS